MDDAPQTSLTPLLNENKSAIYSLIEILRGIKGASGRAINQFLQRHGPVWQEESFDHVLRSSESVDAKAAYILGNPVRKGLVRGWRAYPWVWQRAEQDAAVMKIGVPVTPEIT